MATWHIYIMQTIRHLFTKLPFATRTYDESLRRRGAVLHVLFAATFVVLTLSALSLSLAYLSGYNQAVLNRLLAIIVLLFVVLGFHLALRLRHYFIAACGILSIYWLLATVMVVHWGVNLPVALLLYGTIIVLSGMATGARYAIFALATSAITLFVIQYATITGHIHPDVSWRSQPTELSDLVAYYFVFVILGISSWLFNRQTDVALQNALRAEVALEREKAMLETKVENRTRELQAAQIDKMQQMYRFAQLGQFSTSLLHDLANHIATLSVDIEGMGEQHYQSQLQLRIKRRIGYIDNTVQWAYDHINGKVQAKYFNVRHELAEVIGLLEHNARLAHVQLHAIPKSGPTLTLYGDPNRFRQIMLNLVSNAIEAYTPPTANSKKREVHITGVSLENDAIRLTVTDYGSGIAAGARTKIFDPFYSTKYEGMGIGLFIVKQIVEDYFGGTIELASSRHSTTFTLTLQGAKREQPNP